MNLQRNAHSGNSRFAILFLWLCLWLACAVDCRASDLSEAHELFYQGDYSACIEICAAEVKLGVWNDGWSRLLIDAHFQLGQYEQAKEVFEAVQSKFGSSLWLRFQGARAYKFCGQDDLARKLLSDIPDIVQAATYRFTDRENRLALGRFLSDNGADAREVLKNYFDPVLKSDSGYVDAHMAIAELALSKSDFQEASKSLAKAVELRAGDPQIHYLLARAWETSDAERASQHLSRALELNPRHAASLLMTARNRIDAEQYAEAEAMLAVVLETNPRHPIAIALRAAVAHLRGDYKLEGQLRKSALETWHLNPEVDYTIGDVLSRHYRFAEAVEYQRRAFQLDPSFGPARFQLAQDLLRLGKDDEGWELVRQVATEDRYNVEAFNLHTLQSKLAQFTTIESDDIWIRMDAREAKLYGHRAIQLLQQAKRVLEAKYDFKLGHRVVVEIFPQQSDFAIRTFGLPGGAGFLGVCFGNVITANSPVSQGETPTNWESVLWHEFCHSITLQKTNNRMPRWLSEGISVYEELERDRTWGQRMSPKYQQMLLGDDFVPLSKLSGAFLHPPSSAHLQFAYFESSLAVRYLIEQHGIQRMQQLLVDLGTGVPIALALTNRYGESAALDDDFKRFVTKLANEFCPKAEFARPGKSDSDNPLVEVDWAQWLANHPNSYYGLHQRAVQKLRAKDFEAASQSIDKLLEICPDDSERGGALDLAIEIAHLQADSESEQRHLERLVALVSDRPSALNRLVELCRSKQSWARQAEIANALIGLQPHLASGHQALAEALRNQGQVSATVAPLQALVELQPTDPAAIHFQLAEALLAAGDAPAARLEVLKALEYSPRYREAQKLLVKIVAEQ